MLQVRCITIVMMKKCSVWPDNLPQQIYLYMAGILYHPYLLSLQKEWAEGRQG